MIRQVVPLIGIAMWLAPSWAKGQDTSARAKPTARHAVFMPDGNLAPIDTLSRSGYTLDWIRLYTVDLYSNGAYYYDNPRPRARPWVRLFFSRSGPEVAGGEGTITQCRRELVSRDTVALDCPGTPIGAVAINGHWVPSPDTTTREADRPIFEQLALVARVVIRRAGTVVYDRWLRFEYLEGD